MSGTIAVSEEVRAPRERRSPSHILNDSIAAVVAKSKDEMANRVTMFKVDSHSVIGKMELRVN